MKVGKKQNRLKTSTWLVLKTIVNMYISGVYLSLWS